MNARKYAWRILHGEIRRRCGADTADDPDLLLQAARAEGVSETDIVLELAGFGAAVFTRYAVAPLAEAAELDARVMAERNL